MRTYLMMRIDFQQLDLYHRMQNRTFYYIKFYLDIGNIFRNYFFFLDLVVTSECTFCQSSGLRRYIGHGGTVINAAMRNPAPKMYIVCENC